MKTDVIINREALYTEQFAILIDSRTRFETGEPGGCWLSMPATKEELHEAMQSVGITADNPQEFFIHGYSDREDRHIMSVWSTCTIYPSMAILRRYAAIFRVGISFIFSRIKSRSASVTLNLICTVLFRPSML